MIVFCGFICLSNHVLGYELETHASISENAANLSVLGTELKIFQNLGLAPWGSEQLFPNGKGTSKKPKLLIGDGARFEDDTPRYFNHFYDPIYNKGLVARSPDWALEDIAEYYTQQFSFKDAHDYLYNALTLSSVEEREQSFGLFFLTLGYVTHHIGDMSQPQHVRNDMHLIIESVELPAIEDPSLYEDYSEKNHNKLPMTGYAPVVFGKARDYWHTDSRQGLADYTNRGFVTADTNFHDELNNEQIYPSPDLRLNQVSKTTFDIKDLFQEIGEPVPTYESDDGKYKDLKGTMDFIGTNVLDNNRPTKNAVNERTSTFSIFNADLKNYNECVYSESNIGEDFNKKIRKVCELYTLNRFNFDAAHKLLIPRAVGYGAGLINHFFRGKLEITMPEEGLYPMTGIDERGFTEVSLKVKNVTPGIDTIDQNMSNGQVVLVTEYKINGSEKFIVSTKQYLSLASQTIDPILITFDFSDQPIPIEATDVSFQVVYQGQLGQDEAIVVSKKEFIGGKLKITSPVEDVYAIVDHAKVKEIDQGFTKIKLKLTNNTPDVNGVPQNFDGKLVLIAKYQRNPCYKSDLTGNNPFLCDESISEEFVSISEKQSLSLEANKTNTFTFDFSEQLIPINVFELVFHIVYQGKMGNGETVVTATKNIEAPSYLAVVNSTDYVELNRSYYHVETEVYPNPELMELTKDYNIYPYPKEYDIAPYPLVKIEVSQRWNGSILLEMDKLDVTTYFRAAALVDDDGASLRLSSRRDNIFGRLLTAYIELNQFTYYKRWPFGYTKLTNTRGFRSNSIIQSVGSLYNQATYPSKLDPLPKENLEPKPVTTIY